MKAKLLEEAGLRLYIAGEPYNFRSRALPTTIEEGLQHAAITLGGSAAQMASGVQVHGKQVVYTTQAGIYEGTDGLVTDREDLTLWVKFADCSPIALYDPLSRLQGLVHSGWRGTQQRIAAEAVRQMVDRGADVEHILAFIGPSIAQEDYEVGAEVYEAFEDFAGRDTLFEAKGTKYHFDIMEANREVLLEAGLLPEHIELAAERTYGNPNLHSAREEGEDYGLNAMFTMIPSEKGRYVQAVIQDSKQRVALIKEADYSNLVVSGTVPQGQTPAQAVKAYVQEKAGLTLQIFEQLQGPSLNEDGLEVYKYYARYPGIGEDTPHVEWVTLDEIKARIGKAYADEFTDIWLPYIDRR